MTPAELRATRTALGLTQAHMAEALATPYRTYQNWESGGRRAPGCLPLAVRWVELVVLGLTPAPALFGENQVPDSPSPKI